MDWRVIEMEEMKLLKKEVRTLRSENAALKKLNAVLEKGSVWQDGLMVPYLNGLKGQIDEMLKYISNKKAG